VRSLQVMKIEALGKLVEALPSVKEVPLDYIFDGRLVGARNYKALVDSKTGNLEAVVSKSYAVVQNRDAFGAVVETLRETCPDAKIRASVLQERGRAWMSVVFSDIKADDGADGIELGFTVMNSYDRSSSVHFGGTQNRQSGHFEFFGLRLACMNGMTMRVPIADWDKLEVKNAADARVGDIVGVSKEFVGKTVEEAATALSFRHIGRVDRKLEGISLMVSALPCAATLLRARVKTMHAEPVNAFEAREKLNKLGFGPRTNQSIMACFASEESTAWGLYNAVTHHATHGARVSPRRMQEMLAQVEVV